MSERMEVVSADHENGTVLAKFLGEVSESAHWTTFPKEAGWYWVRCYPGNPPYVCRCSAGPIELVEGDEGFEVWSERIQEPEFPPLTESERIHVGMYRE